MKRTIIAAIALSFLFVTAPSTMAAEKNPYGTSNVDPAGPNEVIFTIFKGRKSVEFTTARLLKMKSKSINIYEPFLKKRQSFTVIPIKNFFLLAGISGNDKVETKALNDYIYTNIASKFIAAQAYIAIKRGGTPISYDQGGPIRIVFADDSKWAKELDAWNWSLSSIGVK